MFEDSLRSIKMRGRASLDWIRSKLRSQQPPFIVVDEDDGPTTLTLAEFDKTPKTDRVVVPKQVIALFFLKAAAHPNQEVGGLLRGTIRGRYLHITGITLREEPGTTTHIPFDPTDFARAREACDGDEMVIGWAHSHVGIGVFMSGTDVRHQVQGQDLDPDYVALVMDPFQSDGVDFNFFRVKNGDATVLPHFYVGQTDGARETDLDRLVGPDAD